MSRTGSRLGVFGAAALVATAAVLAIGQPADAGQPIARAELRGVDGSVVGEVVFKGQGHLADRVDVELDLPPGAPGLGAFHGIHIHTTGSCDASSSFASANGHWNPTGAVHGHHAGDLPSVLVSPTGRASATSATHRFDVSELFDRDGSAVILHNGPDNFANIPSTYGSANPTTLATGDAGGRYACGIVTTR